MFWSVFCSVLLYRFYKVFIVQNVGKFEDFFVGFVLKNLLQHYKNNLYF
nr:MAG TPA: hypothetical protein [Caudoviricetes sp.]